MSRRPQDAKVKTKRNTRSGERTSGTTFSDFLNRSFSQRGSKLLSASLADLSVDPGNPGILKVFGESLQAGAAYKSILVSPRSTASEVVGEVLERYGVSRRAQNQFLLCDAVGQLAVGPEGGLSLFTEECSRRLRSEESVMAVQSLWRAAPGLHRRLEIRRKLQLGLASPENSHASSGYHSDNETRGINENARNWARAKLPSELRQSAVPAEEDTVESATQTADPPPRQTRFQAPTGPHLLQLRGWDSATDCLTHELSASNLVGHHDACDLRLPESAGIAAQHCVIRCLRPQGNLVVEPCVLDGSGAVAAVAVNGKSARVPMPLQTGDVLSIGNFVFLLKDGADRDLQLSWLPKWRSPTYSASFRSSRGPTRRPSAVSSLLASRPEPSASLRGPRCDLMVAQLLQMEAEAQVDRVAVPPEAGAALLTLLVRQVKDSSEMKEELQWQLSERVCTLCQRAQVIAGRAGLPECAKPVADVLKACAVTFECFLYFKMAPSDIGEEAAKEWKKFFETLAAQMLDDAVKCLTEVRGTRTISLKNSMFAHIRV